MYKSFGFSNNPFSILPLRPTEGDASFFVGRQKEVNSFQVDISSEDRSLILVTGHRGVGKTSFVSVMQYAASPLSTHMFPGVSVKNTGLIPCYHKVQIDPDETVSNLLFKSLTSLLFSIREFQSLNGAMFPTDLQPLLEWVSNVVPSTSSSAGLSIAGFGGSFGGGSTFRSVKDIPPSTLCEQIKTVIEKIKGFGCRGIFLNLDNLEIVDESVMASLMNHLRDYLFEIKGLWIVLIGYPGMYSVLTSQASRVSEYISGHETFLDALSADDCIQVLNLRKNSLTIPGFANAVLPLEEQFIRNIYRHTDGEIRTVLKACDDITRAVFKANPTIRLITEEMGLPFLKNILKAQLGLTNLKPKERDILEKIVIAGSIRPKDYANLSLKSAVDFTNRARPLLEKNLLRKELDGIAARYEASGSVRLGVYSGLNLKTD